MNDHFHFLGQKGNHMKKIFTTLLVFIMTLTTIASLAGCGSSVSKKEVSEYLKDASPESSALAFYVYDGSTTTIRYLFDERSIKDILSELSKVKAFPVADYGVSKASAPFYGINIGSRSGEDLNILFAGGFAILADGRGYEFDYDFTGFESRYAWRETQYCGGMAMPCSYYVANGQSGWKKEFLNPCNSDVNNRLVVKKTGENGTKLELEVTNNLGMDWIYGEYWGLEILLDDTWYAVPLKKDLTVNDIAYGLPMGESRKHTYDLSYYGELPEGSYRLVISGLDIDAAYDFSR